MHGGTTSTSELGVRDLFGAEVPNASPPPGLRRPVYGPTVRVSSSDVRISVDGTFSSILFSPVRTDLIKTSSVN